MEQGRTGLSKRGEDEREVEGEPGICWVPADIGHGVLHQKKKKKPQCQNLPEGLSHWPNKQLHQGAKQEGSSTLPSPAATDRVI